MNNKGFTLTELLVSLAILAIITGLAFPAIEGLKTQNETKKYESFSKVLTNAAKMYIDNHKVELSGSCHKVRYYDLYKEKLIKSAKINSSKDCSYSYVIVQYDSYDPYESGVNSYYPVVKCCDVTSYQGCSESNSKIELTKDNFKSCP